MAEKLTTVLIVDDTEATRYVVGRILRKGGYAVLEASAGQEALRLAAEGPDLIILDVNLPDMSGHEVCRQLKAAPQTASIPVLHLSANFVHSEDRAQGLEEGADGYLIYPLEPRELLANVEALLRVRQAEQALRAQRELLSVTLSSIGDGVIATDGAGAVTFINPVAQQLTGWAEPGALGRSLGDIFRVVDENGAALDAGLGDHALLVRRDGQHIPIQGTAAPIHDGQGKVVGVVRVFRDVTERRRLDAELRRRADELLDRDQRKDEFLAMLAHELRNPLAPIRNCLTVLRRRFSAEPDLQGLGAMMTRQVSHMVRLLDDLLDVSRVSRGKMELKRELLELKSVLASTVEAVRPFLEERQHRLDVEVPEEPLLLEGDPARLEQVVTNLLTNAGKYTPPGGHIELRAQREGNEAVVRVKDNGIGIRPEILPRLFEMFLQADRLPGKVSEGLGLGLTLVKRLTEMHGGQASAASAGPGQGSEFVVRLPLAQRQLSVEVDTPSTVGVGRRVLIVDDNEDGANSLALLLKLTGHRAQVAYDGPAALETARAFLPEVVFLDIGLPKGMDGYEVARQLRELPGLERAFLVALTGYGQAEDLQRSRVAGLQAHCVKPVSPEVLADIFAQVPGTGA